MGIRTSIYLVLVKQTKFYLVLFDIFSYGYTDTSMSVAKVPFENVVMSIIQLEICFSTCLTIRVS